MSSPLPPADHPNPSLAVFVAQAPTAPGVYLFKDGTGRVLYVGKAVNLKNRLSSYLKDRQKQDPKTSLMLRKATTVEVLLTAGEREALILERNLIKTHRPRFNVVLRDDKNFLCLRLDLEEDFPALRFVRRFSQDGALYFGPYASAGLARQTLKVMKQVFGLRTCKERRLAPRSRPCLEYQVGRCLGPCAGLVSQETYRQAVQDAVQFLRGRGRGLLKALKSQMVEAAARLDYEKAAILRDRQQAIRRTLERQDMASPTFKDQDVLGLATAEDKAVVLVIMVRGGLVTGSREYYFPTPPAGGDLLGAFLKQYYNESRPLPDEIFLPVELADRRLLAEILSDQKGKAVHLVVGRGKSGDCTRLLSLAQDNADTALKRRLTGATPVEALKDLQTRLRLAHPPKRLECLDISTLQGAQAVGALVTFTDGRPDKSGYRRFRIRQVIGQDDYAMLREVVQRHYSKAGQVLPDLLVVDGGKGQLQVVWQTLAEMGLNSLPVAALAKARNLDGKPVPDRLFLPGRKNPKFLPAASPGLLLLQRLRDEAHRFAIGYHRRRAREELLASELSQLPGIGPARLRTLFKHYGCLEELNIASLNDLAGLPGFTRSAAQAVKDWLARRREARSKGE